MYSSFNAITSQPSVSLMKKIVKPEMVDELLNIELHSQTFKWVLQNGSNQ